MRLVGWILALVLVLSGCTEAPTPTVTKTENPVATVVSGPWSESIDTVRVGSPPPFPSSLDHWRFDTEWDDTPRAFSGQWSAVAGADSDRFPATMNGCDSGLFLVRWRAVSTRSVVRSTYQHSGATGNEFMGESRSGTTGWMILDQCQIPQFTLERDSAGSTLTDVAVSVQHYWPAP